MMFFLHEIPLLSKAHDDLPSWILTLKKNSQVKEGCQISDAFGNGARQIVATKNTAPKYVHGLG